jgi:hypothetical protein
LNSLLHRSDPKHQHHKARTHFARMATFLLRTRFHSGGLRMIKTSEFIAQLVESVADTWLTPLFSHDTFVFSINLLLEPVESSPENRKRTKRLSHRF